MGQDEIDAAIHTMSTSNARRVDFGGCGPPYCKFREAMTAPMIDALASMVNAQLEVVFQGHDARTAELAGEIDYGL